MHEDIVLDGKPVKLTHTYPFRIGLISDLQVGAQQAIFPPKFRNSYGGTYTLNRGQKKLWRYMLKYIEELNVNKVSVLVVLGDICGGQNWIERGAYMMMTEMEIQTDACAFLLAEICKRVPSIKQVLLFRGTPYHGIKDTIMENYVATKLITKHGVNARYLGEFCYIQLKYGKYKRMLWLAHPTTGATVYPETVLGRDIGQFLQAFAMGKLPRVDMVIRAHRHEYMELHKSTMRYMILPCWQFFVPYDKAIKWYSKWQPDIGGAILLADDKCRLRPWHFTYPNMVNPKRLLTMRHSADKTVKEKCLS